MSASHYLVNSGRLRAASAAKRRLNTISPWPQAEGPCSAGSGMETCFSRVMCLTVAVLPFTWLQAGGRDAAGPGCYRLAGSAVRPPNASSQSRITLIARPWLPTWQWFWACSASVKTLTLTDGAAVSVSTWSPSMCNGT